MKVKDNLKIIAVLFSCTVLTFKLPPKHLVPFPQTISLLDLPFPSFSLSFFYDYSDFKLLRSESLEITFVSENNQ